MTKSDFTKQLRETVMNELNGIISPIAKQSRKTALQAEIRDLQIQLKEKNIELSSIR